MITTKKVRPATTLIDRFRTLREQDGTLFARTAVCVI